MGTDSLYGHESAAFVGTALAAINESNSISQLWFERNKLPIAIALGRHHDAHDVITS